ncbi:MAG: DUF547 domain-containing protein [Bacteroidota bacterium]
MSRFIPIILASTIFFACNTKSQEQTITSSETSEAKVMTEQPTAIPVAQKETTVELDQLEATVEETSSVDEKINTKPVEKIAIEDSKKNTETVESKIEVAPEMKQEKPIEAEEMEKMPSKTEEVVEMEESEPVEETVAASKKEMEAEPEMEAPKEEMPKEIIPTHQNWDQLVRKYISATGKVNYKGFKADKAKLEAYLQELANNPPKSDWKRNEAMAYWINAYNANTIKLIVDNYPVKSIMDLYGGKAFDRKWIKIGDKTYSLNNIENDILRPRYKDARIHFAVNCAAKSCPPIHNRAWTATNLNGTLQAKAKAFINNAQFNSISKSSVELSKIFEWYAGDFGNIITYLNKYAATEIKDNAKVGYKEYNWALNE